MKTTGKVVTFLALAGIAVGTIMFMKKEDSKPAEDGFVGRSSIVIGNGHMTPEVLLALGRLGDVHHVHHNRQLADEVGLIHEAAHPGTTALGGASVHIGE